MTKKDLKKALRWLKNDTQIIYQDSKNVVHGIEKICYSVDSDGHTFLVICEKKQHLVIRTNLSRIRTLVGVSAALSGANPYKRNTLMRCCLR